MNNKIKQAVVAGLFPMLLTSNFGSALETMSSTSAWTDFGNRILASINLDLDEAKYQSIDVIATAYSSTVDQTDDTPLITASGGSVGHDVIAANFLPFHTKVKIPELYGDKIFTVEDRMNRRYNDSNPPRIDIWQETRSAAKKFGRQATYLVIIESPEA